MSELLIYKGGDRGTVVDVRLEGETVWLTQRQMAELFDSSTDNIGLHLKNIYAEKQLTEPATTEDYSVVQSEGRRRVRRTVKHYNLDAIISVGYRVNSKRGTQFRIWATRTLNDHLAQGYTLHEQRLREIGLGEVEQGVALLARTLKDNALVTDEGRAVLDVVQHYARTWRLLLAYDEKRLAGAPVHPIEPKAHLSLPKARASINQLRGSLSARREATALFGRETSDHLGAILGAIEQTFDGKPLYPTVQARAAHLLYFVIKDHPFTDGNKRIGTLLFLEYLRRNGLLVRASGEPRLADNAMVALALLVAASDAAQKDLMIRLTLNLLEDGGA